MQLTDLLGISAVNVYERNDPLPVDISTERRVEVYPQSRTCHVSAELANVLAEESYSDGQLPGLLENDDARQILHVTFGKALTTKSDSGGYLFRNRLLSALKDHEQIHYANLQQHFQRHVLPLKR